MNPREILSRLLALGRRNQLDRVLAEDLAAHVELLARDLRNEGLSPAEALAAARRQVGNLTAIREQSRDAWGFPSIEALLKDLRYAVRGLRRSPGFSLTVILTLGLGIGANAAMFGVIDRAMLRPFPFLQSPHQVNRVYLQSTYRGRQSTNTVFPYRRYLDLQTAAGTIGQFAAQTEWRFAIGAGPDARIGNVAGVTASYFGLFDAPPLRGRYFLPDEDRPPLGARVAVLSATAWRDRFGSEDVIGRSVKVGQLDYTIVGIAPPGFVGAVATRAPEVFLPLTAIPANLGPSSQESYTRDYSWDWVQVLVRRKAGASTEAASAELTQAYIRSRASARAINPRVQPDSLARPRAVAGPVKQAAGPEPGAEARVLLWATGVAFMVLLIACANVANLTFARVLRRRRETTVRLALGVSRRRLLLQLVAEALVLTLIGCLAGLVLAQWGGLAIRNLLLPDSSVFNLAQDWRTIGFALGCGAIAVLLTSVGPALLASRTDLGGVLRGGMHGASPHRSRTRAVLVVFQGALSTLLLVGAGLFVRSFLNVRAIPLGFDPGPVIEVIPDFRGFAMDSGAAVAMERRLLEAARNLPGVEEAARVNARLYSTNTARLAVDGVDSIEALGRFNIQIVSSGYFDVLRIRLLRGRLLSETDRPDAPLVAVVSEAMGTVLWPGKDPIGRCLFVGLGSADPGRQCTTVVGIVANTAQQNLSDDPRYMYYLPIAQVGPDWHPPLLLRMTTVQGGELERVRRAMSSAMPGDGFVVVRPLQEVVDGQTRSWRIGATLFIVFGALALLVAIVGLYGVISYNVVQRQHELGVRAALGARAADVVWLVVAQGARFALVGVGLGLALALVLGRWVQPLLFRLTALDPLTYGIVGAGMLLAAFAASAIPAARAARADPNLALRAE